MVVVHYRTPEVLDGCLERVRRVLPGVPVIVVDADSGDGTPERLAREYPWVQTLVAPNHSMAHAVNTGLKTTRSAFVLQMNADVFLEAGAAEALLAALADPAVGMVGPRCRDAQGRIQDQGPLYRRHHLRLLLSRRSSVRVPWLSGCCTLLRREALEAVGGLDGSLRFYNEDTDWCYRLSAAGYACHLVATDVKHLGGASTPADARFWLEGLRGGMQLSRRYRSPRYRRWHRRAVLAYGSLARGWLGLRRQGSDERLAALQRLFGEQRFDESPFGATLNESNERFG